VQPGDEIAWDAVEADESAANQNVPVGLDGSREDTRAVGGIAGHARIHIETVVQAAVAVEPRDAVPRRSR
jgi:hypothetical protein